MFSRFSWWLDLYSFFYKIEKYIYYTIGRFTEKKKSHRTQKSTKESVQLNLPKTTFSGPVTFFPLFLKMCHSILTVPVIFFFMKLYVARTFFVELHLGEVLVVVGSKLFFYKLVDKYHRNIHRKNKDDCLHEWRSY